MFAKLWKDEAAVVAAWDELLVKKETLIIVAANASVTTGDVYGQCPTHGPTAGVWRYCK